MSSSAHEHPPPSRADLDHCVERVLRPATRAKPAILLVRCAGHRAVVKDFSQNPWLLRGLYGRYVVAHECRVYRALDGVEGVPPFHGRIDAYAFAVDYIEGTTLKRLGYRGVSARAFERLQRLFAELHRRGVVHLDAHQKTNVLVDEGGEPYLMDFATALCLGQGWLARKVLVPLLGRADWRGFLKLKARYCPEALTDAERQRWRWLYALGWLWPATLLRRLRRGHRKRRRQQSQGRGRAHGDEAGDDEG
ncbi:MAG: hypothetical protein ACOC8D_01650 [bacterium]